MRARCETGILFYLCGSAEGAGLSVKGAPTGRKRFVRAPDEGKLSARIKRGLYPMRARPPNGLEDSAASKKRAGALLRRQKSNSSPRLGHASQSYPKGSLVRHPMTSVKRRYP